MVLTEYLFLLKMIMINILWPISHLDTVNPLLNRVKPIINYKFKNAYFIFYNKS